MLKELNQGIEYMEVHLTDDLSLESISDYAGVSDYHFRTVFFHLSGMTVNEYVKNRKLSEAKTKTQGRIETAEKVLFYLNMKF